MRAHLIIIFFILCSCSSEQQPASTIVTEIKQFKLDLSLIHNRVIESSANADPLVLKSYYSEAFAPYPFQTLNLTTKSEFELVFTPRALILTPAQDYLVEIDFILYRIQQKEKNKNIEAQFKVLARLGDKKLFPIKVWGNTYLELIVHAQLQTTPTFAF